ncbi:hypothetical protein DPMN_049725 [Dreissena polymorpha]|uniref:Uncharacterized protein n=1 Tax=Dreissena polymorpha TaxID=45954 RepID=A0A9D4HKP7_DREPO|nr:hypothetical protein DPMN_049725 [Dreissena polymorpha]
MHRAYPRCDHVVAHRLCGKYYRNQQPHHLRRYRLRVYVLQVALLRVPPLALVSEQELMPALVPATFPTHSFYAIWVRFNESDHGRATMVVPANNRRATIAVFNGERRSSIDRALFDILSSDRSLPLTPRLLVA